MSLDQNLFTLHVTPRADDRNVVDLVDPKGVAYYTKRRVPSNEYNIEVCDPLSESVLASVTAPSATSKHKTLQLHNPDLIVELKYTGTLSFKWSFKWEDHDFEWKREECYILRKPDPAVLVAVTKEPPGRLQTRAVQILDYNLNRFDIEDRKGLEIVILTALLTFQDSNETYHTPKDSTTPNVTPSPAPPTPADAPVVPPRPAPRQGLERVTEMHTVRNALGEGDANEVHVWAECDIEDYAQYAEQLLKDEAMLFVSIRSASAAQVSKVLRVVEETKRLRHKSGLAEEEELHQYVIYETEAQRKGPRRINLDDPDPKKAKEYAPPTSLTVHLSKIDMPELRPKPLPGSRRPSDGASSPGPSSASPTSPQGKTALTPAQEIVEKERKKAEKERRRAEKEARRRSKAPRDPLGPPPSYTSGRASSSTPEPPPPNKLTRPAHMHTPAHQPHAYQPSPSPSQLGNPAIYAAPPPGPPPVRHGARPAPMAFPMPGPGPASPSGYYGAGPGMGMGMGPGMNSGPGQGYVPRFPQVHEQPAPSSPPSKGPVSALLDMWSKH